MLCYAYVMLMRVLCMLMLYCGVCFIPCVVGYSV
jgi:hypothetical protein